ncbi:hypothetical protein D3C81_1178840 [compost metagenome]
MAQQPEHRHEQRRVADALGSGRQAGQSRPEPRRQQQHGAGRAEVHRAPSGQVADHACHHAGEQQAEEDATLGRADHAATFLRRRSGCGVGNQPLRHGRTEHAGEAHRAEQANRGGRQPHRHQREHQSQRLRQHQVPPREDIAQWHQQHQGQRAANLRDGDHPANGEGRNGEVARQGVQQRLRIVDIGHAQATGAGKQQHQAPTHTQSTPHN